MARMYTKGKVKSADIILTDPINDELSQAVGELNGGLDQHNMPLDSVTRTKLVPGVKTITAGPPYQESTVFPSQAYHIAEYCDAATVTINVDQWQMGWNKFEVGTGVDKNGFVLDFTAIEGMLKGEVCIDFEHRQSYFIYASKPPDAGFDNHVLMKDEHTGELGVFVNDVLVVRTGPLWIACGRHSYVVPFATPVASGPCHIDVRWMIDFKNVKLQQASGTLYEIGVNQVYPISIHHRTLWCRNQYR